MRAQVVMNGLVSYWDFDEAGIKGAAEIFGYLEGFAMMCWWCLVNLDAYIEESRIYGAVLDREP